MIINISQAPYNIWNHLFRYVYDTIRISYAYKKSHGKLIKYYNDEYDYDPYDSYDENSDDSDTEESPIFYKFSHSPEDFNQTIIEDFDFYVDENITKILQNGPLNLYLKTKKKIVILNPLGFNHDERGLDRMKINLPFHKKVVLIPVNGKIPFKDFIRACFDIKSRKFDFWYELYCDANVHKELTDKIIVKVSFDHGS